MVGDGSRMRSQMCSASVVASAEHCVVASSNVHCADRCAVVLVNCTAAGRRVVSIGSRDSPRSV